MSNLKVLLKFENNQPTAKNILRCNMKYHKSPEKVFRKRKIFLNNFDDICGWMDVEMWNVDLSNKNNKL